MPYGMGHSVSSYMVTKHVIDFVKMAYSIQPFFIQTYQTLPRCQTAERVNISLLNETTLNHNYS